MAATPSFTASAVLGFGSVTAANTNRDGTGTIVDIVGTGSTDRKISRVIIKATGDPAASIVTLYLYDGSTYRLFDEFDMSSNPSAASATAVSWREERVYEDLNLPSTWKLGAAITVALTSGAINVFALGGTY